MPRPNKRARLMREHMRGYDEKRVFRRNTSDNHVTVPSDRDRLHTDETGKLGQKTGLRDISQGGGSARNI
jgi:hypothetical protein